jgi:uncharacterized OB-fold protein
MTAAPTETTWSRVTPADGTVALVTQRCAECGQIAFPPTAERCPRCWSTSLSTEDGSASGSVYSYTIVRRSFPGRETPYVVGLIDLDDGLRVMAAVGAERLTDIAVGTRVTAYPAASERPGLPATAYEFRPAPERQA